VDEVRPTLENPALAQKRRGPRLSATRPEYVPWTDVEQVDFDGPPAVFPPPTPGS